MKVIKKKKKKNGVFYSYCDLKIQDLEKESLCKICSLKLGEEYEVLNSSSEQIVCNSVGKLPGATVKCIKVDLPSFVMTACTSLHVGQLQLCSKSWNVAPTSLQVFSKGI